MSQKVTIPDDLKQRYADILADATENGGEFTCDEEAEVAKLIERIDALQAQLADLQRRFDLLSDPNAPSQPAGEDKRVTP